MQFISNSPAGQATIRSINAIGLIAAAVLATFSAPAAQAAEARTMARAPAPSRESAKEAQAAQAAQAALAARLAAASSSAGPLAITMGKGTLLRLNEDATSVFVADPSIADVQVPSPRAVFVLGKKAGVTTVYALGANSKPVLQRTVQVTQDVDNLQSMISARFPGSTIKVISAPGSLQLEGEAPSAQDADAAVQMVTPYLIEKQVLVDRMTISRPLQVQLKVRITEVDRNVTQQMGINWQAVGTNVLGTSFLTGILSGRQIQNLTTPITTSSGTTYPYNLPSSNAFSLVAGVGNNVKALVDVLNQENLLTVLAEPTLVALSGQTASFLAGGEFPIPTSQINGAIAVEFKQFGVKLDFTPTVLNENRISLKVRPEVSQIDTTSSVTTNGLTIPGLSVRRADTTVELGSGQSFMIGGLLQSNTTDLVSQVPGLGSIPILGKLFSSTNYQNNKTELVIIVTPYLVNPTDPKKLRSPIDSLVNAPSRDVEYAVGQSRGSTAGVPAKGAPRLSGNAGYIY
jgi:pilus assembly protein CpaC